MKARIPLTDPQKKVITAEIKKQIAEMDEKHALEIDAMVLWVLYSEFGFREKRLKRFFDVFNSELDALIDRYLMNNSDIEWLCARKLKDCAGIDIYEWSKEDLKQ